MRMTFPFRHLGITFAICVLAASALTASAKDVSAFDLAKEGNKYVGEQAKDKVVQIRSDKSIGTKQPSAQDQQTTAHAAEIHNVAKLGPPAIRIEAAAPRLREQPRRCIERERERDQAPGLDRANAQHCSYVICGVQRQHAALHQPEGQRARHEYDDDEQNDRQRGHRWIGRNHSDQWQAEHDEPAGETERDREPVAQRTWPAGRNEHRLCIATTMTRHCADLSEWPSQDDVGPH